MWSGWNGSERGAGDRNRRVDGVEDPTEFGVDLGFAEVAFGNVVDGGGILPGLKARVSRPFDERGPGISRGVTRKISGGIIRSTRAATLVW